jgi:c-di-GMP-binding flagellar brake protein YcgR
MSGQEKRRFPRLSLNTEVNYTVLSHEEAELFTTGSRNISSGGICIIAFEKLNTGDILDLKFSLPGLKKFVVGKGRVVWINDCNVEGSKTDNVYEVGIEFVNIKEQDKNKIQEFVISKTK